MVAAAWTRCRARPRVRGLRRRDGLRQPGGGAGRGGQPPPRHPLHGWNKVRLTLTTHSEGGLTEADHALAAHRRGRRRVDRRRARGSRSPATLAPSPDGRRPSRSSGAHPRAVRGALTRAPAPRGGRARPPQRLLRRGRVRAGARAARPLEELAEEGERGAARRWPSWTTSSSTCRPASSASRWPRWASASSASRPSRRSRAAARRQSPHGVAVAIASALAYLVTLAAHHDRRAGPKIYAIQRPSGRAPRRPPAHIFTQASGRSSRC